MIIARYDRVEELRPELEQIEQTHDLDPMLLHAGIFARGYTAFFSGDLKTALGLLERLVPGEHEQSVFHGNAGRRILALCHLACVRWAVGEADVALEDALAIMALAEREKVPILAALAHVVRARLRYLRRDPLAIVENEAIHAVRAAACDLGLHTEANAFGLLAEAKRAPLALTAIEPLLDALRSRLSEVATCSSLLGLVLIDVLRISEHVEQARRVTDEIIAFATTHGEKVFLSELLRARGEQRENADPAAAAQDYHQAIELARAIGARISEARATASLGGRRRSERYPHPGNDGRGVARDRGGGKRPAPTYPSKGPPSSLSP